MSQDHVTRPMYVDPLVAWSRSQRWRWSHACHLFVAVDDADDAHVALGDLDVFARRIGLRRQWRHDSLHMPHYDLNPARRRAAVAAGAVEVDHRFMVEVLRRHRSLGVFTRGAA